MDANDLSPAALGMLNKAATTRAMQQLLGICSGLMADAVLNDKEISYLQLWLLDNQNIINQWPANAIANRITQIKADGIITDEERSSLVSLLSEISGNYFHETGAASPEAPVLPIEQSPRIDFINKMFCFTGEFIYGNRANCERAVLRLGSMAQDQVSKNIDYLVIGSRVSPYWTNTTYGRKIEAAVACKQKGIQLQIISEQQWISAIEQANK